AAMSPPTTMPARSSQETRAKVAGGQSGATTSRKRAPNRSDESRTVSPPIAKSIAHQDGGRSTCQCGGAYCPRPISSGAQSTRLPVLKVQKYQSTIVTVSGTSENQ